jgi:hypothetical protein
VLRLEENCVEIPAFTPKIMKQSTISLFAIEGNLFDMKAFHQLAGYDEVSISVCLFSGLALGECRRRPKGSLFFVSSMLKGLLITPRF